MLEQIGQVASTNQCRSQTKRPTEAGRRELLGGFGGMPPPGEILNFSLSEMRFAAFSGPFGNFFSS